MYRFRFLIGLALVLACVAGVSAQTGPGELKGFVIDSTGAAIAGAKVTLSSPAIMRDRTVESSDKGAYRFVDLPPGVYTITAGKEGYKQLSQQGVSISAGKVTGLNLSLETGEFSAVVTVIGDAPLIDVDSTHQSVNISGELQRMLPTTTRNNFSELLRLMPGTVMADPNRPQYSYYQVKGADQYYENNWTMDGAKLNQWEYSYMSARVNLDAVDDVEIGISGANATNPLGQGGIVHMTTKSGGNEFSGSASIRWQPTEWNDTNIEGGTPADNDIAEYGFSFGGYVIKDHLWFFATGRNTDINEGLTRSPVSIAKAKAAYPSFSPDRIDKNTKDMFAKITYSPNDDHIFAFGWQHDWGYESFASYYYDPSAYIDEGSVGPVLNGSWSWSATDNLNIKSQVSWTNKDRERLGRNRGTMNTQVYESSYIDGGVRYGRNILVSYGNFYDGYGEFAVDEQQWQVTSDANYYIDDFSGSHDVKFGIYAKPLAENQFKRFFTTSPVSTYYVLSNPADPSSTQIPFYRITYDREEYTFEKRVGKNFAVYLNDVWKPTDRLSIEVGLRYDYVSQADEVEGNSVDVVSLGAFSPNIGINYALTEDRKNVIRASYAMRHQNVTAYTLPTSEQGLQMGYTEEYDVNLDGIFETVLRQNEQYIDPRYTSIEDLSLGYTHDFIIGYSRELPWNATLNIDYTYRQFRDMLEWYNTNPIYENGVFVGVEDPTFAWGERWQLMNNEWNWKEYHSLDVTFNRNFSDNFTILASYTFEYGELKGDWSPYSEYYHLQPGTFPSYAGDRGHSLRFNGTYIAPYGIEIATSIQVQGGSRSGALYYYLDANDTEVTKWGPTWIYQDGNWVYNPLSTTYRYAGADRKEGRWRAPMWTLVNARVGKTFNFEGHRIGLALDVFNLFNSDTALGPDSRGTEIGSPYYRMDNPNYILTARSAQVTVRYSF